VLDPVHISLGDIQGGAARAANRIHQALIETGGASRMLVRYKATDDWRVETPSGRSAAQFGRLRSPIGKAISALQRRSGPGGPRNSAWLPSHLAPQIAQGPADVAHLHWIASETISVSDILRLKLPLVWTMHDMWPLCGLEHYAPADETARWRTGYHRSNRPASARGLDLDRHMWRMKSRLRKRQLTLVSPSEWLADCARASAQFHDTPVEVIGHPLDLSLFRPMGREFCRDALHIPQDAQVILFGAVGGSADPRKGFDLLQAALHTASASVSDTALCVVFGQSAPKTPPDLPLPVRWLGRLNDDLTLAMVYSAADVMVVPSRQEAFGLTAAEASACGCPVLTFDKTGVADIVSHRETGYLAQPFEADDLAVGLDWILSDKTRHRALGGAARARAEARWSYRGIVAQYQEVYANAASAFKAFNNAA